MIEENKKDSESSFSNERRLVNVWGNVGTKKGVSVPCYIYQCH